MRYRNPGSGPSVKTRELRRLWEVKVYVGDPDAKKPKTKYITVVAFNTVEAIRLCGGKAASEPVALSYVTWPENPGDPILQISDTSGPTDKLVDPTVPLPVEDDEDWGDDKLASEKPKPKSARTPRVTRSRFKK